MVFVSLPEITRWGNFYSRLPGVLGPSPSHRGGRRAPFVFSRGVAGMAVHTGPRAWPSPRFQRPVQRDVPVTSRFLVRPQLLTRLYPLPV